MNGINKFSSVDHLFDYIKAAPKLETTWNLTWDKLPSQGVIVPIWDGDYLYYASYWDRNGHQFWIVTDHLNADSEASKIMKKPGEQVYPIYWMNIEPPTK